MSTHSLHTTGPFEATGRTMLEDTLKGKERDGWCPMCGSSKVALDQISGERVCVLCGLVVDDEVVDRGPEWRAFSLEELDAKRRTGLPNTYTMYDKGLYTSFSPNRDSKGRRLDSRTRRKMRRLKMYDKRAKLDASGMRNLSRAMNELNRLADRLHLPQSVKEEAAVVYRRALKRDLIKGRTISGFVAASVYAACRKGRIPRSLQEVSDASTEDKKDIARTYRYLIRELNLKLPVDYPMKFVPKIAAKLDISRESDELSIRILREARERRYLTGRDPRGMAAAALYMACKAHDERVTQKDIAWAADTTEVTLRNRLRDLEDLVEQTDEFNWIVDD
ncbi:MAG: transcription initiation factor IIB family protein [Candidatus Bathyarchaeia archaeon]